MNHGPSVYTSIDVPFSSFPLGLTLQQRWNKDDPEFFVEAITLRTQSTKHVKPGYILHSVNGKKMAFDTLSELHTYFGSLKQSVSATNPLVCTFRAIDVKGVGTPLFDPFHNTNELQNSCGEQTVQKYEHTNIGLPMTTFPQTTIASSTTNGLALHGGRGGLCGDGQWLNANDVINVNDLEKHMINVDSDFRQAIQQATSDFTIKLDPPVRNVIRIRLASAEIPNTFYEFSHLRRNIELRLISPSKGTDHRFIIKEGNYDSAQLQTALNTLFLSFLPQYVVTIDSVTAKTTISTSDFSDFIMDFRTEWNSPEVNPDLFGEQMVDWGLAYNLGYRQKYYSGASSYQSEAIVNTMGDPYIFLKINDYNTVKQPLTDGNILEAFTKILLRTDKNTEIFNDSSDLVTREYVFPQPRDINRLHIRLMDKWNNFIDLNDMPVSLAIELTEVKNCKLYDFYRNYLFTSRFKG